MSNLVAVDFTKIEGVLIHGDLSKLSTPEKVNYYNKVCNSLGLNPLTKPFDYIKLNGKEVLYAKRDCTDQLRRIYGISIAITKRESLEGLLMVTAQAEDKAGRKDEAIGAVSTKGLSGEALANAYMKAETKAKRRATLSICGLGLLDEAEIETAQADAARDAHAKELTAVVNKTEEAPAFEAADYFREDDAPVADDLGEYEVKVGKKYKGKKLKDIPIEEMASFTQWVSDQENPHQAVIECANKMREYIVAQEQA